ncbi:MAG: WHG domain-containing protein [Afipia sp.]|jgi:AcrR family transcriptional regulator|nr:WHG domain-containing protein [Afipia sp.]MCR6737263.1 WHG domain-containing protein [Afipia sp.]
MSNPGATKLANRSKASLEAKKPVVAGKKGVSAPKKPPAAVKTAHKSDRETPYHHGDLHEALLQAAKRVAEREGLNGLTLRAVAREAGVSHAAPAHHFGDVTGLLSELAAIGFQKFSAALGQAVCNASSTGNEAQARANAYVAFARDNPCMFQLMFRAERLDHDRPMLHEASKTAFAKLAGIVAAQRNEELALDHLTLPQAAGIARIWSLVHGFAMLHLDGRLQHILDAAPGVTEEMLLAAMLKPDSPAK